MLRSRFILRVCSSQRTRPVCRRTEGDADGAGGVGAHRPGARARRPAGDLRRPWHVLCRGVNRRDIDALRSCYYHDVIDEHGSYSACAAWFVAYAIGLLRDRLPGHGETTTHMMRQVLSDVASGTAVGKSYFSAARVRDRRRATARARVPRTGCRPLRASRRCVEERAQSRRERRSELRDDRRPLRHGEEYPQETTTLTIPRSVPEGVHQEETTK